MRRLHGPACRITIFIGDSDRFGRRPLYEEIVRRAHDAGLAGATVLRGSEGYGASSRIHTTRLLDLSEDLPIAVVIVDDEQRIRDFLPQLDEIVAEGLVIVDRVEVHTYAAGQATTEGSTG